MWYINSYTLCPLMLLNIFKKKFVLLIYLFLVVLRSARQTSTT
jgi:hypothetical protein